MKQLLSKHHHTFKQLFNAGLRMASLGIKLVLTLYMGRYLGLTEMGTYGLVAAIVAISIPLLGMRIDYVMAREIVDVSPLELTGRLRDQIFFYLLNYAVFITGAVSVAYVSPGLIEPRVIFFAVMLAVVEGLGTYTSGNLIPLRQPILSNILFFIRSALWVIPVIGVGFFVPAARTADFVFYCWLGGVILSLMVTAYVWRTLPWREVMKTPMDWVWLRKSIRTCLPMWLGGIATAVSTNFDRFAVEHYLGRDEVGIISFYGSFASAIIALVSNGISVFIQPDLIAAYRRNNLVEFKHLARKITLQASSSAAVLVLGVGVIVPLLGTWFGRPEFTEHAMVLWWMLLGIWLRMVGEGLYHVLYARHQDRPLWSGNMLMLVISLTSNILLVSRLGLIGVGYSAALAGLFLLLWRLYWVMHHHPKGDET